MHNELSLQEHTTISAVPNIPLTRYTQVSLLSHHQSLQLYLKILSPHHDYQILSYYNKSVHQAFGLVGEIRAA
jgi:hypothetical protein